MVKYTVDRFEGDLAVLLLKEDESLQLDVRRCQLPDNVQQGDIVDLQIHHSEVTNAVILKEETENVRQQAEELLSKILRKNHK